MKLHSCGCWQEAPVPHHRDLFIGWLECHIIAPDFPPSQKDGNHNAFYNLPWEVAIISGDDHVIN